MRFVHYYRRGAEDRSGVVAAIEGWIRATQGVEQRAVLLFDPRIQKFEPTWESVPVRHFGRGRGLSIPLLGSHLSRGDILVLHEGWVLSNLVAVAAATRKGIPFIVMPHGVYEPGIVQSLRLRGFGRRGLERWVLRRAGLVHNFYDSEARLVHAIEGRARCRAIPSGIDSPKTEWRGGGGYLLWFGRYAVEHKGLDLLIAAVARLPENERPLLRLHGYDYEGGRRRVEEMIARENLQSWISVGDRIDGAQKSKVICEADGYVHPSRWEAHSVALLEVLATGAPCLLSNSIHISEPLAAAGGALVVDCQDEDAFAASLVQLPLRSDLGSRARAFVREHFDWANNAEKLVLACSALGMGQEG